MENTPTPSPTPNGSDYQDLDDYLSHCETALINAADPQIAPLLTSRSYTPAIITAKLAELTAAKALVATQKKEYGDQYAATEVYAKSVALLHPEYMDHLALARVAFKNDTAAKVALGLKGERAKSESSYTTQALLLYNGILNNAAYKTKIATLGVTDADLQAGKTGYAALATKGAVKVKESGEAQAATKARDKAIDAFAEWFSDFKEVATVALRKSPQMREKLGWKE